MGQTPTSGWYPDPQDADQQRWWDGAAWSGATRPRAQDRRKIPWIAFALGALVLVGGGVALVAALDGADAEPGGTDEVPAEAATPDRQDTLAAEAELTTPIAERAWTRAAVELTGAEASGRDDAATIYAVTRGGPGWVAVGGDGRDGAVWTSQDARTWSRVAPDNPAFDGELILRLVDVTVGGPGLVAVGWDGLPPAGGESRAVVLTSTDGHDWERVPHDPALFGDRDPGDGLTAMFAVMSTEHGLIAAGRAPLLGDRSAQGAAFWISADGTAWTRVAGSDRVFGGEGTQEVYALVADGPNVLAVGNDGVVQVEDGGPEIWRSTDGTDWRRVGVRGPVRASMGDAVARRGGFVAVGTELGSGPQTAAAWHSEDGQVWTRGQLPGGEVEGSLGAVAVAGAEFIAVGDDFRSGLAIVWRSRDGVTWVEHPGPLRASANAPAQRLNDVVIAEDLVVVAGRDAAGPAVWILAP